MKLNPRSAGSHLKRGVIAAFLLCAFTLSPASAQNDADEVAALRADAEWLLDLFETHYAYLDRFDGVNPARGAAGVDIDAIQTRQDLLTFSECALMALQDHHAFMGPSNALSPGLAPGNSDLWIDQVDGAYVIAEVRAGTPAQRAGVRPGWRLTGVDGVAIDDQIDTLCGGPYEGAEARGFAARMLAVGPRTRARQLSFETAEGEGVDLELASLYMESLPWPGPITSETLDDGVVVLTVHNGLVEGGFRAAVDEVLDGVAPTGVILDLRDTRNGGDSDNARALLGRFVDEPTGYQRHSLPLIERDLGVPRAWLEEVWPLEPDLSDVPVVVIVGRWTGSMGEGTAMGFHAAADATVVGAPMAQLLGAVNGFVMPNTGWSAIIPFEKLFHVDRTPREDFQPDILVSDVEANPQTGVDRGMDAALAELRRRMSEDG